MKKEIKEKRNDAKKNGDRSQPWHGKRVLLRTFGCQMNRYDSDLMRSRLAKEGYSFVDRPEEAAIIIFNSCSVREHAEERLFSAVNQLKKAKRKNPSLVIALCGCTAQKEGPAIFSRAPHVDIVLGTSRFQDIALAVKRHLESGERIADVSEKEHPDSATEPVQAGVSAYITAIRGCSNFCSYCVVPYLRGREKSRKAESIAEEARMLADGGVKEICLLGQNILAYGRDLLPRTGLPALLEALDAVPGIERLRFLTSHPRDLTEELIGAMARIGKVCESIHLPLQAGSDRVLELMGRGYTRDRYRGLLERLRSSIPGIALTTDIIAGFPSETDGEFEETLSFMREAEFDDAFLYMYSPRKFTRAGLMDGQLETGKKKARLARMIELQRAISEKKNRALLNARLEVLAESASLKSAGMIYGRTRTGKNVLFAGDEALAGRAIEVRITKTGPATLIGERILP